MSGKPEHLVSVLRAPGTARVLGLAAVAIFALAAIVAVRGLYETTPLRSGAYVLTNRITGATWTCIRGFGCSRD